MFGSTILDVATGLILGFLGVSLAASAMTEALSSLFKIRQKNLLTGIQALFNDPEFNGFAKSLYEHALINPLTISVVSKVTAKPKNAVAQMLTYIRSGAGHDAPAINAGQMTSLPAYIDTTNFVAAFTKLLDIDVTADEAAIDAAINRISDDQIKVTVRAIWLAAQKNVQIFEARLGGWFDTAMDRISGSYKRYTQVVSFVCALIVAFAFNVDAVHITTVLWHQTTTLNNVDPAVLQVAATDAGKATTVLDRLTETNLVGWVAPTSAPAQTKTAWGLVREYGTMAVGWIVIALGSLFGAPFWFDALKGIVQLRGTGPANRKKKNNP